MSWNPRYVAYARAHQRTPEQMLAQDEVEYPGGKMAGFMIWIQSRWSEFEKASKPPRVDSAIWRGWMQDEFDQWLKTRIA